MPRWHDLHRAIEARDEEAEETIWLEHLESALDDVPRFLEAARRIAQRSGGKRQAGLLLWMLAESLKECGLHRDLVSVYAQLARMAPDDGTVRQGLVEAARLAHGDRQDLDALLERSGVLDGPAADLAAQAARLESYLTLGPGAYVFHASGWGVGRIVGYVADRGRCIIDFRDRAGHEMDLDAAAERLERLPDDDIRARAMADPRALRKWANERPLEALRQVLARFSGSANLRHLKDALVPDAVPTSRWSTWWKEARRRALLDPRFHVGRGRDPRLEYHDAAGVDFRTQAERTLKGCPTPSARLQAAQDLLASIGEDDEARVVMGEILRAERDRATDAAHVLGWDLLLARLEARDLDALLRETFQAASDPRALLRGLEEEDTRRAAGRALVAAVPEGAALLREAALGEDDPVLAEVGVEVFAKAGHPEFVPLLLDRIDEKPSAVPNLFAWYVRGLRRGRWEGRTYEAVPLAGRLLKVIDAVEYRSRRRARERDRQGVAALAEVLTGRGGELVHRAAEEGDRAAVRHLLLLAEKTRGLSTRQLQKVQAIVLHAMPDALRVAPDEGAEEVGERLDRIYMTPEGQERLRREYEHLVHEALPANAQEIARAREFGDLSENAEYHAARERQALLQAKADALKGDLARAVPITPDLVRTDAVSVGTRVRVRDDGGHELVYTLLGPPDADVEQGVINYLTPLGQALMGRRAGEHVQVRIAEETRDLEILEIESGLPA